MPFVLDTRWILILIILSDSLDSVRAGKGSKRKAAAPAVPTTTVRPSSISLVTTAHAPSSGTVQDAFEADISTSSAHDGWYDELDDPHIHLDSGLSTLPAETPECTGSTMTTTTTTSTTTTATSTATTTTTSPPTTTSTTTTTESTVTTTLSATTTSTITVFYTSESIESNESSFSVTDAPTTSTTSTNSADPVVTYPRIDSFERTGFRAMVTNAVPMEEMVDVPLGPGGSPDDRVWVDGTGGEYEWVQPDEFFGLANVQDRKDKTSATRNPPDTKLIDDDGSEGLGPRYTRWKATETRGKIESIKDGHFVAPSLGTTSLPEFDDDEWVADEKEYEEVMATDPACLPTSYPDKTGVIEVVACAVALAVELEEKSRVPRRTALNLARDGIVVGAQNVHDGAELVVDSIMQLPWSDAARTVYDGTIAAAVSLGQTGKAVASALAETRLAKRATRAVDELVTGASINAMGATRQVLGTVKEKLEGTLLILENRMATMENRLNPPALRGQIVKVGDDDDAILVDLKNPRAIVKTRRKKQSRDVFEDEDEFEDPVLEPEDDDDDDALV